MSNLVSLATTSYFERVCNNVANTVKSIGSYAILIIGLLLVIMAVYHIAKGIIALGKTAWFMVIGTLLFGGFLVFGGWFGITGTIGKVGKETVDTLIGDMTPTVHAMVEATSDVASSSGAAQNAINSISGGYFLPFGKALAVCVGVILVIMATFQIMKYFLSLGRAQISFVSVAAIAILGSILFAATPTDNNAGWQWLAEKAVGILHDTVIGATEGSGGAPTSGITATIDMNFF